jgi:hypothetical protein
MTRPPPVMVGHPLWVPSPGGTAGNSPVLQRWETRRRDEPSPGGTTEYLLQLNDQTTKQSACVHPY